jgi:hypothetical protein
MVAHAICRLQSDPGVHRESLMVLPGFLVARTLCVVHDGLWWHHGATVESVGDTNYPSHDVFAG